MRDRVSRPALLPTVFDPFVTTKTKGDSRASGLGLTVVKAVTEAQGGTVELSTGRTERRSGSTSRSIGRTDALEEQSDPSGHLRRDLLS